MDKTLARLLQLVASLRDPQRGCQWEQAQTFDSLTPYLLEEAYEAIFAIECQDYTSLKSELGDLLLQIIFQSQIASEQGLFNFSDVVAGLEDKLKQRHQGVGSDPALSMQQPPLVSQRAHWERVKERQRHEQGQRGVLAGIPDNLPALVFAGKIQQRAAQVNFDWNELAEVFTKLEEELGELKQAMVDMRRTPIFEEMGDVLFTMVNLARHLSVHPEMALRSACHKFIRRFEEMEKILEQKHAGSPRIEGKLPDAQTWEAVWQQAKQRLDD